MAGSSKPRHFFVAGCLLPILVASIPLSSETLKFKRYREQDLSRPQNVQDVETETQEFGGCRDRDSLRLKNLEDVETETH